MGRGAIWLLVGIGIIIYNKTGAGAQLVLRGTEFDYGYAAVLIGLFYLVVGYMKGNSAQRSEVRNDDTPEV